MQLFPVVIQGVTLKGYGVDLIERKVFSHHIGRYLKPTVNGFYGLSEHGIPWSYRPDFEELWKIHTPEIESKNDYVVFINDEYEFKYSNITEGDLVRKLDLLTKAYKGKIQTYVLVNEYTT